MANISGFMVVGRGSSSTFPVRFVLALSSLIISFKISSCLLVFNPSSIQSTHPLRGPLSLYVHRIDGKDPFDVSEQSG